MLVRHLLVVWLVKLFCCRPLKNTSAFQSVFHLPWQRNRGESYPTLPVNSLFMYSVWCVLERTEGGHFLVSLLIGSVIQTGSTHCPLGQVFLSVVTHLLRDPDDLAGMNEEKWVVWHMHVKGRRKGGGKQSGLWRGWLFVWVTTACRDDRQSQWTVWAAPGHGQQLSMTALTDSQM